MRLSSDEAGVKSEETKEANGRDGPSLVRQVLVQSIWGLIAGYAVLHPVSMLIFNWLDPRLSMPEHSMSYTSYPTPLVHSFTFQMAPMAILFGLIGAAVAGVDSYRRGIISRQRDNLQRKNEQLLRLELENRRTALFMAHDFKTHLSCISEFTEHLMETRGTVLDSVGNEILKRIRRQAHRMIGAVMDLLAFGQLQNSGEVHKEKVNLSRILRDAIQDFSLPDHEGQVTLGEKHWTCPPAYADPKILSRVVVNLVSNSLKHNSGSIHVLVDAELKKEEVIVSCSDDGRGIPQEVAEAVFDRDDLIIRAAHKNLTGFGLPFCRRAIEAHGGRIWCDRSGNRVCFALPITA